MLVFFGNSTILRGIPAESRNFWASKKGFFVFTRVTVAGKIINRISSRRIFNENKPVRVLPVNEHACAGGEIPQSHTPRPATGLPAEAKTLGEAPGVLRQPDTPKRPSRSN